MDINVFSEELLNCREVMSLLKTTAGYTQFFDFKIIAGLIQYPLIIIKNKKPVCVELNQAFFKMTV